MTALSPVMTLPCPPLAEVSSSSHAAGQPGGAPLSWVPNALQTSMRAESSGQKWPHEDAHRLCSWNSPASLPFHQKFNHAPNSRPARASQRALSSKCPRLVCLSPPSPRPPANCSAMGGALPPCIRGLVSWVSLLFPLSLWGNPCPPSELSSLGYPLPQKLAAASSQHPARAGPVVCAPACCLAE